ncbi:DSC E3 ubiquitin ligase complex subunit 3 [Fulvia fulva]|uniref:DSC E3 ubiquitin ligase complex subunit 3 n=1 Tax=Passalora fulva TaxID=5499 RepID=A0A9Q8L5W1_PASFU|nr:DSC E3 ubiquitin ligase complex subunit 3 [Fulvia fulva]KAK4635039.1 DSC E3 ubiquitin ligase complex subunit 3 [Fulvia fulva]KAK4636543.1 DSC E3 ubiquitin ligase complex subunit 3 [Fulvia fulva]UJO11436.1 DSC E3 ubiquitin ligase complex subunit 3 [Fulvia fulva]WPV09416.1 DSC E3 ubiquitin ligase complex subunit 3 [Fulvia fulva]WPV23807.1 DSC E3 ubiquitin ligase complex subunit 3 [Fulvia fulva]
MDERPIDVVVRFSTSNPDIILNIPKPGAISNLAVKQRIRAELEPPASTSRLRLIHAGKVLQDGAALSGSVNVTPAPPSRGEERKSAKAKGKEPLRDIKPTASRVYIHCSIGDALSALELATEARNAEAADVALGTKALPTDTPADVEASQCNASTTTPAPRGFDRLLSAGFSTSEVAALRTQFLAIQSHTHTPDTMPTGPDLLALEERWLDNTSNPSAGGGDGDTGGFGSEDAGGLEDMLYGNLIGFFWPIGAMCWLMREEGVWTRRRQVAVLSGFLVNITFGFLRVMN